MADSGSTAFRPRSIGVALGVTAAAVAVVRVLLAQLTRPVTTAEEAVVGACLVALVACAVWAWLAAMAVVLEACAAGAPRTRIPGVPSIVRRLVLAACGVVVAGALSQPASAAGDDARRDSLAGLPMPERALGAAITAAHHPAAAARSLVVRPGDSLWSLAAEELGRHASTSAVEARWRSIYRLNRALIGPDPDLIRPGQLLELPPSP